jgi:hypothetical protein
MTAAVLLGCHLTAAMYCDRELQVVWGRYRCDVISCCSTESVENKMFSWTRVDE